MVVAVWALCAWASQIMIEEIPLADVIGQGDAAVVVEVGEPAMRHVEIPVPGSAEKACGTYAFGAWRVTVREVVRPPARGPALRDGQVINVFPGNTPELIRMSTMACVEDISVSPIVEVYRGEEADPGERLLVLMSWSPPYGWVEAVPGSWLPTNKADAVRKATPTDREVTPAPPEELLCVEDADCSGKATCQQMRCKAP